MDIQVVLVIVGIIVVTNLLGFLIGEKTLGLKNMVKRAKWDVVTLVPKIACGILFPIFFGLGIFLNKKSKEKAKKAASEDSFED